MFRGCPLTGAEAPTDAQYTLHHVEQNAEEREVDAARVRVRRAPGGPDRMRSYKVVIDGETVGSVRRGETKCFGTQPGVHDVLFKVDWARSSVVHVDLTDDLEATVLCWPRGKPLSAIYWITIGRNRYIGAKVVDR